MIKRIYTVLLVLSLFLKFSLVILACDEEQTNTYVLQVLFGDNASMHESDKKVELILNALYICSEQSNKDGQDKLNFLKKEKVSGIPDLEKINVSSNDLLYCSHNAWEYKTKKIEKVQDLRKDILRKTVTKIFDFEWFDEIFKRNSGQIDSFSALLYYSHILADYIAADPRDTEFSAKGYDIPAYSGVGGYVLNGNVPSFTTKQKKENESYHEYSDHDEYGRCGVAIANIGKEMLDSAGERNDNAIHKVLPTGWIKGNVKYEMLSSNLYNRCHLIAHMLGGADTRWNLITGTRYLNENMETYEKMIANHIDKSGTHVLYRVTPVYRGDNLVASGVQLEAYSIEDKGELSFNVYLYNVQPGVDINYANGNSEQADQVFGNDGILPFVTVNPSNENSDLLFEIDKQIKILFANQTDTTEYKEMIDNLSMIADEARNISGTESKLYVELKKYQYDYIETLAEYVPKLLANEPFFVFD